MISPMRIKMISDINHLRSISDKAPPSSTYISDKEYLVVDCECIPNLNNVDKYFIDYYMEKRWDKKRSKKKTKNEEDLKEDEEKVNEAMLQDGAIEPVLNKIVVIGLKTKYWTEFISKDNEQDSIREFSKLITTINTISNIRYVTFNGLDFDFPMLFLKSVRYGIKLNLPIKRYATDEHFDVRAVLTNWDSYALGDLDFWSKYFGLERKEGTIKGEEVYEYYKQGKIDKIIERCGECLRLTEGIYLKLTGE